jgi:hypothetical protein
VDSAIRHGRSWRVCSSAMERRFVQNACACVQSRSRVSARGVDNRLLLTTALAGGGRSQLKRVFCRAKPLGVELRGSCGYV